MFLILVYYGFGTKLNIFAELVFTIGNRCISAYEFSLRIFNFVPTIRQDALVIFYF